MSSRTRITSSGAEDISPAVFATILQCVTTNQIELTALPLVVSLVRSQPSLRAVTPSPSSLQSLSNQPVSFLLDQVLHRLLQYYARDAYCLLCCLAKCTLREAVTLLQASLQSASLQSSAVAMGVSDVGVAYSCLVDDARSLALFRGKSEFFAWKQFLWERCRVKEVTPESVLQSVPALVEQNE